VIDFDVVTLSRVQFALTALYHFLFVPLTLGLSMILVIMESVYVMTGREIWKRMTRFWGVLFGINFAMGVATGITMEFQFGTNWAYYSHYVGDIFGAPLAIEGLMAFFLESTFVGLFFFGWERLSKVGHLIVTALVGRSGDLGIRAVVDLRSHVEVDVAPLHLLQDASSLIGHFYDKFGHSYIFLGVLFPKSSIDPNRGVDNVSYVQQPSALTKRTGFQFGGETDGGFPRGFPGQPL
jgi:uncharacterized membrane protein